MCFLFLLWEINWAKISFLGWLRISNCLRIIQIWSSHYRIDVGLYRKNGPNLMSINLRQYCGYFNFLPRSWNEPYFCLFFHQSWENKKVIQLIRPNQKNQCVITEWFTDWTTKLDLYPVSVITSLGARDSEIRRDSSVEVLCLKGSAVYFSVSIS